MLYTLVALADCSTRILLQARNIIIATSRRYGVYSLFTFVTPYMSSYNQQNVCCTGLLSGLATHATLESVVFKTQRFSLMSSIQHTSVRYYDDQDCERGHADIKSVATWRDQSSPMMLSTRVLH